jgi:hypothetical protein
MEFETYNQSRNITIATFSEFGFFKKEGYESNLWAGKILAEHGVPLAYKSVGTRNGYKRKISEPS